MADMMCLIRQGVKLRPVPQGDPESLSCSPQPVTDSHTQKLQEAITRISQTLRPDSESEDDIDGEFDED